jgi:hypothetical protein
MTQKDKDLLLKDLCARLPYGVKVQRYSYEDDVETIETLREIDSDGCMSTLECETLKYIAKPYLFPLSSMTEEQYYEMQTISGKDCLEHMEVEKEWRNNSSFSHLPLYEYRVIDFFIKNHFDYRGLIPMGLAIDATGLNIY